MKENFIIENYSEKFQRSDDVEGFLLLHYAV